MQPFSVVKLLGSQVNSKKKKKAANLISFFLGRYSTLAGFVDAGESVEECVHREVHEEVGIEISHLKYFSSQSWPFPASLMLGFFGEAKTTEIHLNHAELQDARWFSREEIEQVLRRSEKSIIETGVTPNQHGFSILPPPSSISYQLIKHWVMTDSKDWKY